VSMNPPTRVAARSSQIDAIIRDSELSDPDYSPPRSASEVLHKLDDLIRQGDIGTLVPLPTGFQPLDKYLDGGLRAGDLVLVGGAQGTGKTTLTLQMARNLVTHSQSVCGFICFEHSEEYLLQRLISLESLMTGGGKDFNGVPLVQIRDAIVSAGRSGGLLGEAGLAGVLRELPGAAQSLSRIQTFGQRLFLMKGSPAATDTSTLTEQVRRWKDKYGPRVILFIDYLQKMPVFPPAVDEEDRVTQIADSLKDLALRESIPVVAVVAADREGLSAQRLRIHHLRGSSSLMYEADVVLVLNNKYRIVNKNAIAFNYHRAQDLRNWVVVTIEKNRAGRAAIDLEFRAHFSYAAFDPVGDITTDGLIDERIDEAV
jgi:replicative DNA helicase